MRGCGHGLVGAGPVALLGAAGLVLVHAELLRTDPAADATLDSGPATVRLWFTEEVEPAADPVVVLDPAGRRVDRGGRVSPDDRTELVADVDARDAGTYTVRWRALSDDGHVVEGTYAFSVRQATAPPAGAGPAPATATAPSISAQVPLLVLARAVHLFGLALALGALTLLLLAAPAPPSVVRRIAGIGDVGSLVLLAAAAAMFAAQSAAMAGSASGGLSRDALGATMHSRWANAWAIRTFAAAVLLFGFGLVRRATVARRGLMATALAASLVLVAATSVNGHAATTPPVWLSLGIDAVHLLATGAWLGGGAGLALLLLVARDDHELVETVRRVVPRFSTLALLCVQALIVTGLYQTWAHVERPALLASTPYGNALLTKLGLFALMAVPAALNRFVMKPRLAANAGPARAEGGAVVARFTRLIGLEALFGALVLVCAAGLSALPPAHSEALDMHGMSMDRAMPARPTTPPQARIFTASAGARSVVVSLDPGALGSNQVVVSLRGADGRADSASVALRAIPPDGSGGAPTLIRLAPGTGDHRALLSLGTAGEWTLEVLVNDERAATFRFAAGG